MLLLTQLEIGSSYAGSDPAGACCCSASAWVRRSCRPCPWPRTGVEPRDAGVASAMVNTSQQVGGAIGTALLNTIAASATTSYITDHIATAATKPQQQLVQLAGHGARLHQRHLVRRRHPGRRRRDRASLSSTPAARRPVRSPARAPKPRFRWSHTDNAPSRAGPWSAPAPPHPEPGGPSSVPTADSRGRWCPASPWPPRASPRWKTCSRRSSTTSTAPSPPPAPYCPPCGEAEAGPCCSHRRRLHRPVPMLGNVNAAPEHAQLGAQPARRTGG